MAQRVVVGLLFVFLVSFSLTPLARADLPETVARVKKSVVAVGTYMPSRSPAFKFLEHSDKCACVARHARCR